MSPVRSNRISPPTVMQYVLETVRADILSGRYPMSSKLDQQAIAAELGVSIIPVRECLRQLEAEGLVQISPRRGAFVVELSVDEFREIYGIREVLEELAIHKALPHYTPAHLDHVSQINARFIEAINDRAYATALEINQEFHLTLYEPARQPLLLDLISSLSTRSMRYRQIYVNLPNHAQQAIIDHEAILDACRSGDSIAAGQAVRSHLRRTLEGVLATLKVAPESDSDSIHQP
ncbi:GntR family transcriptional regulator [Roseiflexus sp.]|uniref:GntR family transcriptional regulator n=1 Tax=Roseiflexus sp. TaxID=2562120 RepID=UPI00398AE840